MPKKPTQQSVITRHFSPFTHQSSTIQQSFGFVVRTAIYSLLIAIPTSLENIFVLAPSVSNQAALYCGSGSEFILPAYTWPEELQRYTSPCRWVETARVVCGQQATTIQNDGQPRVSRGCVRPGRVGDIVPFFLWRWSFLLHPLPVHMLLRIRSLRRWPATQVMI